MEMKNFVVKSDVNIKTALQQINDLAGGVLFVINNEQQVLGSLSDGDIRRQLINNQSLDANVSEFMNTGFSFIKADCEDINTSFNELKEKGVKHVPVVKDDMVLVEILHVSDYRALIPVDAVIMAGGRGERLRPLTDSIPKPLLKVGDKPIIEYNIDRLVQYGVKNINISIRYLGEQLVKHFKDGSDKNVSISYVSEDEPLGTIGALRMVENYSKDTILLMNSDLLTNIDFEDMFETFKQKNADIMIAATGYEVDIPYAVMEVDEENTVKGLSEKPKYTYYSNAGIYLIKKELLSLIPSEGPYDTPQLIEKAIEMGRKVVSFPIRGYWLDIGKMNDFEKANRDIEHINW